jgi:hypothetical protein
MYLMDMYIWNYNEQFGTYLRQVYSPKNNCSINWPHLEIKSAKILQDCGTMRRDQSPSLS